MYKLLLHIKTCIAYSISLKLLCKKTHVKRLLRTHYEVWLHIRLQFWVIYVRNNSLQIYFTGRLAITPKCSIQLRGCVDA
ncbi:hypothetical protein BIW11_06941 [Tropilaelaps mercedesae]|uniref:Uncharacterized protein n=1 Tax=Tropilaelaps mercedesae TaxID=418985 RepID=A0A1V9XVX3_9ACAR|nr:hypothetical protein BIW11_06941 [Tropilaelaps mercedesae]